MILLFSINKDLFYGCTNKSLLQNAAHNHLLFHSSVAILFMTKVWFSTEFPDLPLPKDSGVSLYWQLNLSPEFYLIFLSWIFSINIQIYIRLSLSLLLSCSLLSPSPYMYIYMYIYICVYIYVYIYMCVCVCVCIYLLVHITIVIPERSLQEN